MHRFTFTRFCARLLTASTDATLADSILGDLEEEWRRRARRSSAGATIWMARTTLAISLRAGFTRMTARLRSLRPLRDNRGLGCDTRQALRSLRAAPWYTFTVIGVIALSMALATTVFTIVDGVLFKPLPYRDAHQLHFVRPGFTDPSVRGRFDASLNELDAWQAAMPDIPFTGFSVSNQSGLETTNEGPLGLAFVRPDFFAVLGVQPLVGQLRGDSNAQVKGVIPFLVSHDVWRRRFDGDASAVGRMIDGPRPDIRFQIAGVMPKEFVAPGLEKVDLLAAPVGMAANRRQRGFSTVVRLPEGVDAPAFQDRLVGVLRRLAENQPLAPGGQRALGPFDTATVIPLREHMSSASAPLFRAVFSAAILLALIACLNVAGLTASRLLDKTRDIALRRALGASSFAIARGLVIEQSLLLLAGAILALAITVPLLSAVANVLPAELHLLRSPTVDLRVLIFQGALMVLAIGLTSWWPGRRALQAPPATGSHLTAAAAPPLRSFGAKMVLASQTAGAMVLVIGGSLLVGSLVRVWSNAPGLATNGLVLADLAIVPDGRSAFGTSSPGVAQKLDRIVRDITAVPGVQAAGAMDARVLDRSSVDVVGFEAMSALASDVQRHATGVPVTPGFFVASGFQVIEGRLPTDSELAAGTPVVAVSRLYASRLWPDGSAIGRQLRTTFGGRELPAHTVVGVVDDVRLRGWDLEPTAAVYAPYATLNFTDTPVLFIRTSGTTGRLIADVLRAAETHAPSVRVKRAATADAMFADTIRPRRLSAWLFGTFAASGLVIVTVGLLGMAATSVARRTREIGIRMALGATRDVLVRRLVWEQVGPALSGLVVGGMMAGWAVQFVGAYLYEMTVYDVRVWLVAVGLVIATSIGGALIPSLRASRVDPVQALRTE
jgi:predicted permease